MSLTFRSGVDVHCVMQMGNDGMVVAAAKVSTNGADALSFSDGTAKKDNGEPWTSEDSKGLINYLMKHRHGTPFEHGCLTIFVNAPIFVWREWHRHRIGFSYNEESARYTTLKPVFYVPPRDRPMFKVEGWKPGRPKFFSYLNPPQAAAPLHDTASLEAAYIVSEAHKAKADKLIKNLKESYEVAYLTYLENLALGIDPGLARDCLPVGIYSGCWVTCNPRSIMAFLSLRTHHPEAKFVSYPLYEIEVAAEQLERIFAQYWPLTYQAFCENGRVAP